MITKALDKETQNLFTPDTVLNDLVEGNNRFVASNMETRDLNSQRQGTIGGQYPKAVILACIDSRVPVEMVFDQGLGDIFVARVAGNFENEDMLGSLEYSCKVAGSKVIMVLGQESCGAVKSACDGVELGNITHLLSNILPAVTLSKNQIDGEHNSSNKAFVARTVENNAKLTLDRIRKISPILKEMESNGEINIVGGVYSLSTGKVTLI